MDHVCLHLPSLPWVQKDPYLLVHLALQALHSDPRRRKKEEVVKHTLTSGITEFCAAIYKEHSLYLYYSRVNMCFYISAIPGFIV